jgi:hypothetical protein
MHRATPFLVLLLLVVGYTASAQAMTAPNEIVFTVNSTLDVVDATPDGICDSDTATAGEQCTLRAAIQEANAMTDVNLIVLPTGTYTLTIPGVSEDQAMTGDLDIRASVRIEGAGHEATVIDGSNLDRVFHIPGPGLNAAVTLAKLTVQHGNLISSGGGNNGGGIWLQIGNALHLSASRVYSNTASFGAGIKSDLASLLVIERSTIISNTTSPTGHGGGAHNSGALLIRATTFSNNQAAIGAGIHNTGEITATNSTFSGNLARSDAGGIYLQTGSVSLNNVTIAHNAADSDANNVGNGGGVRRFQGTLRLANTIIANNTDGAFTTHPDCSGEIVSDDHNLIGTTAGCTITGTLTNVISNTSPMLAALADNGGPTLTHVPLPGSPAIDAGNPLTPTIFYPACTRFDQRWGLRPTDGDSDNTATCDIGAVEFGAPLPDVDQDGDIDVADIQQLAAFWQAGDLRGDLNGNGMVTVADIMLVAGNFGQQ